MDELLREKIARKKAEQASSYWKILVFTALESTYGTEVAKREIGTLSATLVAMQSAKYEA